MEFDGIHRAMREAEYLVRRAQENAVAGDPSSAIQYLNKAIEKYPHYAAAYILLGNCQDSLDNHDDAIASYDKALQIDPGHAEAWFNKGMSLKKSGQIEEATQCVKKAIDLFCGRQDNTRVSDQRPASSTLR